VSLFKRRSSAVAGDDSGIAFRQLHTSKVGLPFEDLVRTTSELLILYSSILQIQSRLRIHNERGG
jgi:hypothetical protein